MKRVTINDVAKLAGVSKSTVSHVINDTRAVEPVTRQKVELAIKELGYRPSSVARSLVSKKTRTAGLLVSDVGNPFYSEVIMGVEDVASAHGYDVFLCNTSYKLERGLNFIHSLIDKSVDGVLFMSSSMSLDLVDELARNHIPAVVLDWETEKVRGKAATISIQFSTGIHQAVEHLSGLGHKKIAHVSGPLNIWTALKRRDEFIKAVQELNPNSNNITIIEGNLRIDGGREAFQRLLEGDKMPSAIFAANDLTALGLLWAARENGIHVPEDLSIIGLDDIELASKVTPTLTTVALPRFEIGTLAMNMLLEQIQQPPNSPNSAFEKEVQTRLIIRQSTSKYSKKRE